MTRVERERGMVTAELMTIAPLAVAFTFLLLWFISLGLTQLRLADASRESARMVARGESARAAEAMARRHAPDGATIRVTTDDGVVTVTVRARSKLPIPFFSGIGSRSMDSTSVAAQESW